MGGHLNALLTTLNIQAASTAHSLQWSLANLWIITKGAGHTSYAVRLYCRHWCGKGAERHFQRQQESLTAGAGPAPIPSAQRCPHGVDKQGRKLLPAAWHFRADREGGTGLGKGQNKGGTSSPTRRRSSLHQQNHLQNPGSLGLGCLPAIYACTPLSISLNEQRDPKRSLLQTVQELQHCACGTPFPEKAPLLISVADQLHIARGSCQEERFTNGCPKGIRAGSPEHW